MHVQARPVLDFLNRLYPADVAPDGVHERALFEQAKGTRLSGLGKQDRSFSPSRPSSKTAEVVNIQYKKAVEQVNRARTKLGRRLSASQVGSRTFDHFIKTECDD
jgi:hypothetical protein